MWEKRPVQSVSKASNVDQLRGLVAAVLHSAILAHSDRESSRPGGYRVAWCSGFGGRARLPSTQPHLPHPPFGLLLSPQLPGSQRRRHLVPAERACPVQLGALFFGPHPRSLSAGQNHSTRGSALSSTLPAPVAPAPSQSPISAPTEKATCSRGRHGLGLLPLSDKLFLSSFLSFLILFKYS